jgi:hypothetical protein
LKFAYNESSFFLIRLFQNFSLVSLSEESQPPDSRAPHIWKLEAKGGRKGKEKIKPKAHLTMFLKVNVVFVLFFLEELHATLFFFFLFTCFSIRVFYRAGCG